MQWCWYTVYSARVHKYIGSEHDSITPTHAGWLIPDCPVRDLWPPELSLLSSGQAACRLRSVRPQFFFSLLARAALCPRRGRNSARPLSRVRCNERRSRSECGSNEIARPRAGIGRRDLALQLSKSAGFFLRSQKARVLLFLYVCLCVCSLCTSEGIRTTHGGGG